MPDSSGSPESPIESVPESPIETLRAEMNAQYAALKESFESALAEKDQLLSKLTEENKELHRAVVRSAFTAPVQPITEKTPEQLYQEQISALSKKTLRYMEYR